MAFGRTAGGGPYEQWVARLQAWSRDPATPLDDLPPLTDATFDSDTYLRLVTRVQDAIAAFMTLWQAEASRAFSRASSTYLLAQEMVRLRHLLEPRRALATHPSWPEEIRKALTDALRLDLDELQRGLEEMGGHSSARGSLDRKYTDEIVAVLRQHSLTQILPPAQPAAPQVTPGPLPRSARRILF